MDNQIILTSSSLSQQTNGHEQANRSFPVAKSFGRTGKRQILHIELWYADGTTDEINVLSPQIVWGHDIEVQWIHMKAYIHQEYERLGVIKYRAHCAEIVDGTIKKVWSWFAFDLVNNQELPYEG